jgi:hypothetical protein
MVRVFALSVVGSGFEPKSCHTNDYKIDISLNVTCSHHDITDKLFTWRYTTIIHYTLHKNTWNVAPTIPIILGITLLKLQIIHSKM